MLVRLRLVILLMLRSLPWLLGLIQINIVLLKVTNAAASITVGDPVTSGQDEGAATASHDDEIDDLIWGEFDRRVSTSVVSNPLSSAVMEVRQYLEEPHIARLQDPLAWWRGRISVYPRLSQLARRHLCMVATSVPSERVFSKSGQLISDRRSRLAPKNVKMVMFLNANINEQFVVSSKSE